MPLQRVPVNLVLGALGAGKTTLVNHLLESRPREERWAVVLNDFGEARVASDDCVMVREVRGCACCTSQVALRSALVTLLRAGNLQRLILEASSAAEPRSLTRVLGEAGIAPSIDVRPTLTVLHTGQLFDGKFAELDVYREQLAAADVVAVRGDLATAHDRIAALAVHGKTIVDAMSVGVS